MKRITLISEDIIMSDNTSSNNPYIDPVDGKLDFSRIPKVKKLKLLILSTLAIVLGLFSVVIISDWVIAPTARLTDFDNLYAYKVIYMIFLLQVVFPILFLPFNAIHMVITKSSIKTKMSEIVKRINMSFIMKYAKTTFKTILITAPIVIFYTWSLQFPFGQITATTTDGQVSFNMPSVWFSLCLILCIILTKAGVVRLLRRLGWAF